MRPTTGAAGVATSASLSTAVTWALLVIAALVLVLLLSISAQRTLRRRRAERLRRRTEPLRPLLLELVAGEPDEQAEAASQLTALPPPVWRSVEPAVVALLGKVRGESRTEVVGLLESRGVLDRGRTDLLARSAVRRARAAELLGTAGDLRSVPALVEVLAADRAGEVRVVAARALGRIGAAEAAAPLLRALHEHHGRSPVPPQVVAYALLRIGPAAADDLVAALTDTSPAVRATALEILGRVGAVASVGAVRRCLREDASTEVRARAATALGRLGMPSALEDLVAAGDASAPAAVRSSAVRALGELGDPRAVPALRDLLDADDAPVAALVAPALAGLGGPGLAVLHEVASADGTTASARAREALGLLHGPSEAPSDTASPIPSQAPSQASSPIPSQGRSATLSGVGS